MDDIDFADSFRESIAGRTGRSSKTSTILGTATSDSDGGVVDVRVDGMNIGAGEGGSSRLPTTVTVRKGDRCIITLRGLDGTGKTPVVTGVVGGGDRLGDELRDFARSEDDVVRLEAEAAAQAAMDAAQEAQDAADEAQAAIDATDQHFWSDSNGIHVTTGASDADHGPNLLANSNGTIVRDGTRPLTSMTKSGFIVYDGDSQNVMTSMTRSGFNVYDGESGKPLASMNRGGVSLADGQGHQLAAFTPGSTTFYDSDGRMLGSYGKDIRLLPEPAPGTSTAKIYIAGDSVHNAGVIRGDFNTGDEDGRLSISSSRWLTLSGYTGVTVKAEANSEPFVEVYGTGVRTNGVLGINNTHAIGGVWFGSDVIYMDVPSKLFMSQERFVQITGSVSGSNFVMFATNGDWNAANIGLMLAFQNGGVILHTSGWTTATYVRVNWMIAQIGA